MLDLSKPYKGIINNWKIIYINPELYNLSKELYGKTLNYLIEGSVTDHPTLGTTDTFTTSLVLKRVGYEIETLNTRYTLGTQKPPG